MVGIGTTTPTSRFDITNDGLADGFDDAIIHTYSAATVPVFQLATSAGTAASPANLTNGRQIGGYYMFGRSNGSFGTVTAITSNYYGNGTTALSDLRFYNGAALERMRIDENGRVGIGTSTPRAPLDVAINNSSTAIGSACTYFNSGGNFVGNAAAGTYGASIVAGFNIISGGTFISTGGTITSSDIRIKDVAGISNTQQDLATLRQIHITDYTMKDKVKFGNKSFKKVIAQQLEPVYPQSINHTEDYIPNIYTNAKTVTANGNAVTLTFDQAPAVSVGDEVRLYTATNQELYAPVTAVSGNSFTVTLEKPETEYFVFGKKVKDFLSVDYDALSMLNISATQELAKRVELLEKENAELKAQAANLEAIQAQLAELHKLKAEVASIQALLKPTTHSAATDDKKE